jgi:hypothetical protein
MSTYNKLICVITGRSITINKDYYQKKVEEFEGAQNLENRYVCKYAKNLLKKGYSVDDIRNMLKLNGADLPKIEKIDLDAITKNLRTNIIDLENFNTKRSDPEVEQLINNILAQS